MNQFVTEVTRGAGSAFTERKNDKMYCAVIDKIGMDVILSNIKRYFEGWHLVTRKTEWEQRFRTAIWEIKREIEK